MSKRFGFLLLILALLVGTFFIYPTINWYFFVPEEIQNIVGSPREEIRDYAEAEAIQAVDQLFALSQSDQSATVPEEFNYLIGLAEQSRREAQVEGVELEIPETWTIGEVLGSFAGRLVLEETMEDYIRDQILDLKEQKTSIIQLGLDLQGGLSAVINVDTTRLEEASDGPVSGADIDEAMDIAMENLQTVFDLTGLSEPSIRRQEGTQRILIDLPGDQDETRIENFLIGRGSLKLQLVDDEATAEFVTFQNQFRSDNGFDWEYEPENERFPVYTIPVGTAIRPVVEKDVYGIDQVIRYIITKEQDINTLDGTTISSADQSYDQFGRPVVNLSFNSEGTQKFQQLTGENTGRSMAVVLDGEVKARLTIRVEISNGRASAQGFDLEEAVALERVFRAGSLPVDLDIVSLQKVGASLGADSVQAGLSAIALGLALVAAFMLIYYLAGGFAANIALVINLFLITSLLSVLNLTLTLTSIAGLILTVGMAVDANVIIFERIKEEYRLGKSPTASVSTGFKKAFWTILDANLTTLIAAIFLALFGTGPIRGFAITLSVGIFSSVFSAMVITRLFFNLGVDLFKSSKLLISWRR
jgi:preprotein translocase subunit SecD